MVDCPARAHEVTTLKTSTSRRAREYVVASALIAAPVMILGFLVIEQRERAMLAGALAFGCLAVLYLVFELLLELSLYGGLVARLLVS